MSALATLKARAAAQQSSTGTQPPPSPIPVLTKKSTNRSVDTLLANPITFVQTGKVLPTAPSLDPFKFIAEEKAHKKKKKKKQQPKIQSINADDFSTSKKVAIAEEVKSNSSSETNTPAETPMSSRAPTETPPTSVSNSDSEKPEKPKRTTDIQHLVKANPKAVMTSVSPKRKASEIDMEPSPQRTKVKDGPLKKKKNMKSEEESNKAVAKDDEAANKSATSSVKPEGSESKKKRNVKDLKLKGKGPLPPPTKAKRKREAGDEGMILREDNDSDSSSSSDAKTTAPTSPEQSDTPSIKKKMKLEKPELGDKKLKAKKKQAGLKTKGLYNPNNMCYRNSVLQFISSVEPLREACAEHAKVHTKGSDPCIACMFSRFFNLHFHESTAHGSNVKNPSITLLTSIKQQFAKQFRGKDQQDASEYLREVQRIIEKHSEKNNKKKAKTASSTPVTPDNIIHDVFEGTYASVLTCPKCKFESVTTRHEQDITLYPEHTVRNKKQMIPLPSVVGDHFAQDKVEATCEKCKHKGKGFIKQTRLEAAPKFLTIHIMRHKSAHMSYGGRLSASKLMNQLAFPPILTIPAGRKVHTFKLNSVIGHQGHSMDFGHYIACVVQPDGEWAVCNDSTVTQVDERYVLRCDRDQWQASVIGYQHVKTEAVTKGPRL